jgi:hypothetical protein
MPSPFFEVLHEIAHHTTDDGEQNEANEDRSIYTVQIGVGQYDVATSQP